MDILYLLVPLSVALVFLSWPAFGGRSTAVNLKTLRQKASEFLEMIDLSQPSRLGELRH